LFLGHAFGIRSRLKIFRFQAYLSGSGRAISWRAGALKDRGSVANEDHKPKPPGPAPWIAAPLDSAYTPDTIVIELEPQG